jgi:TolB-like protein/Tfp pilus assembly protein PilF
MGQNGAQGAPEPTEPSPGERLDSWKEIAAYLKRDIRTVRRWEKTQALPVHRHEYLKRGLVYAYKHELDAWWTNGNRDKETASPSDGMANATIITDEPQVERENEPQEPNTVVIVVRRRKLLVIISICVVALLFAGLASILQQRQNLRAPTPTLIRSLAVLPMVDRSGGSPQDYFADGITKDLITELGKTRGLPVMSYQAVSPYKGTEKPIPQIAKELGVDAVVEGSVSRTAERVSISVELIAADPQRRLWARSFSHDIRDASTLPREVAQAIAGELNGNSRLTEQAVEPSRPTSPELYEMYLKGRYLCTRLSADGNNKGIAYLEQVVAQDPAYADAFASLAYCYTTLAGLGYAGHAQLFPQAEVAARKAIALDPSSVEGHIALGSVRLWFEWDWHGAQEELEQALKLNPSSLEAHREYIAFLTAVGRVDEAATEAKKAATLDPISAVSLVWMGCLYVNARRYDEAITAYNKALELDPHFSYANIELAWTYAQKNMKSESRAALERSISLVHPGDELLADAWLAKAYVLAGRRGELSSLAARWETRARQEYISASRLAVIYGDLGENARALHWLTKGMNERSPSMIFIKADPLLDPVRNEPRFQEMVKRMNFPP